ncbi:hypothetical protein CGT82_04740 [Vibrio cholerae]|nr:hypothetical protein CGT82_04740 [Vibrio cholerae]
MAINKTSTKSISQSNPIQVWVWRASKEIAKRKYGYWVNDTLDDSAEDWLETAQHREGSWWVHWNEWLNGFADGSKVEPYPLGNADYPVLYSAPGEYVKQVLPIQEA